MEDTETGLNLVGYARVSTDNQKEEGTITIQHTHLAEYAKQHRQNLLEVFSDEAVSGAKELAHRPALAKLFDFLDHNPQTDGVLIYKLDRLARDLYVQEHIIRKLQEKELRIISIKEPDLDSKDPMRKAFRQFSGLVSELERAFIAMRLHDGRMKKARAGGYAGGGRALGYRRNIALDSMGKVTRKDISIDKASSETILTIFAMHQRGESLNGIARTLNRDKVPTARGGKWYARTVKYILENQVYSGRLSYSGEIAERADLVLLAS